MKREVVGGAVLVAVLAAAYIFFSRAGAGPPPATVLRYESARYGLSFEYPAAYRLQESDGLGAERLRHTITLTRAADLPLPEAGEGPPTITIDLYQNDRDAYTTERWIRDSSSSNFKLGAERLATTTISGSEALSYRWSGLYEGTTIAIARPAWVYAFTVTYMQPGDDIVQDFVRVRDSVRLAP